MGGGKYLVSFCNGGRARLAVIGDGGFEREIDLELPLADHHAVGLTGITFHGPYCVVGVQSTPAALLMLDRSFRVAALHTLEDVSDLHGIASVGDEIVLVSSGTNQVMAFAPGSGGLRIVWANADSLSGDLHLNDVAVRGDAVFCSGFGVRGPDAMRDGDVFDAASGDRLVVHLREPHSVAVAEDALYVLESATGDLLRLRRGFAPRRICGIQGYARGLAVSDTHFAIGKSGYRAISRQHLGDWRLAPLTHSTAAADALRESGVYIVDRATLRSRFVDTTSAGSEIYQVALLPPEFHTEEGEAHDLYKIARYAEVR
jgi:hypothetical protein